MTKKLEPFTTTEKKFVRKIAAERDIVETRFPLVFGLLITFGFVSTLYGFEKLIDRIELFEDNPWILLATGLILLLITGTAYKKLN
jgi:hypothetical protein